jgi:sulfatase modifying factor 1
MIKTNLLICISLIVFLFSGGSGLAARPSADLTADCFVDYKDFTLMAGQWLNPYDCNGLTEMADQWLTADPDVFSEMAYVPFGVFEMGDHHGDDGSDELPLHDVLPGSFFIGRYEVTNSQYCDFLNSAVLAGDIKVDGGIVYAATDSSNSYAYCETHSYAATSQIDYSGAVFSVRIKGEPPRDMSNDPMVEVSWYGSAAYCNWRSSQKGYQYCYDRANGWDWDPNSNGYRMPTEAEWEYSARGGERSPYYRFPWGDTITHSQANYYADPDPNGCPYDVSPTGGFHPAYDDGVWPYTAPVDSFTPNGFGLYNMIGNVNEWCSDWYDENYYSASPVNDPTGPASGVFRVLRGGSWGHRADRGRTATRHNRNPGARYNNYGFRIVLDLN